MHEAWTSQKLHNFRHACSPVTPDTTQLQTRLQSCHSRHCTTSVMSVVLSHQTLHNFRHVCCRVRPDTAQLQTCVLSCQTRHYTTSDTSAVLSNPNFKQNTDNKEENKPRKFGAQKKENKRQGEQTTRRKRASPN